MSTFDGEASRSSRRQRNLDPFCWAVMAAFYGQRAAQRALGASWQTCNSAGLCELRWMCVRLQARQHAVRHARNAVRIMRSAHWARYV